MKYDPVRHHRRSIRLKGYDYSQGGAYFVTMCTHHRECLFGQIVDGEMRLNESGQIVAACWQDITRHFGNVALDEFAVMPNHLHGIIVIGGALSTVGAKHSPQPRWLRTEADNVIGNASANANYGMLRPYKNTLPPRGTQSDSLAAMVQNFKSVTARRVNVLRNTQGAPVWQRNYYEHIIRGDKELDNTRAYIGGNAACWAEDENNPDPLRGSK